MVFCTKSNPVVSWAEVWKKTIKQMKKEASF
jgi:hypothetical protein